MNERRKLELRYRRNFWNNGKIKNLFILDAFGKIIIARSWNKYGVELKLELYSILMIREQNKYLLQDDANT